MNCACEPGVYHTGKELWEGEGVGKPSYASVFLWFPFPFRWLKYYQPQENKNYKTATLLHTRACEGKNKHAHPSPPPQALHKEKYFIPRPQRQVTAGEDRP